MWERFGAADDRLRSVLAAANANGRLEVFGLASDDTIWRNAQDGAGAWSGWQQFGAPDDRLHTLAMGVNADGRLELAGTAADDSIWFSVQAQALGPWVPWMLFGPPEDRLRQISMARHGDGRIEAFGTAADDTIWHQAQTVAGRWPAIPIPLPTTFAGTATLTTSHPDPRARGPFVVPITLGVVFDSLRTAVEITSFPSIVTSPFPTPFGMNTTTVSYTGGGPGTFTRATGAIAITVDLLFNQSIDLPLDSTITIPLSTAGTAGGTSGSPLNALGPLAATLVGAGTFVGGFLGGRTGTLVLVGALGAAP